MKILAIETSCDDTCAAVLDNDKILSNIISSQTDLHSKWGGVVPDIAKRAHTERIDAVIAEALLRSKFLISNFQFLKNKEEKVNKIIEEGMKEIDVIGVTLGPGLAIALGIGVNKAKELAIKYNKKLVAVNHIEGHIWANFLKNKNGKPERNLEFPALALTVSGGHTKIILISNNQFLNQNPSVLRTAPLDEREQYLGQNTSKSPSVMPLSPLSKGEAKTQSPPTPSLTRGGIEQKPIYTVVGETLDDAAGEALDKAAKMLGLGYPGGPIIERLAQTGDKNYLDLPHPLADKKILDYSFSGLKTSFYYKVKDWPKEKIYQNLNNLAATFQNSVFETLLRKYKLAIERYQPKTLLASGGVLANLEIRKRLRKLAKEVDLPIFMPTQKKLNTDNAAMIGRVAYNKALLEEYVGDVDSLDRDPRLSLS